MLLWWNIHFPWASSSSWLFVVWCVVFPAGYLFVILYKDIDKEGYQIRKYFSTQEYAITSFVNFWIYVFVDEELRKIRKQTRKKNGRRPKTASTDRKEEEEEKKEEEKPGKDSECKTDREGGEEQSDDDCGKLDRDLERKSRQLNLTAVNVRDILHVGLLNSLLLRLLILLIAGLSDKSSWAIPCQFN